MAKNRTQYFLLQASDIQIKKGTVKEFVRACNNGIKNI